MKANELRIGNYVDWDDKTIRSIVKGIHPSSKYVHLENGWVDLIRCEPIPLTEEWLVRFGFYSVGDEMFDKEISEKRSISCSLHSKAVYAGSETIWVQISLNINFIHQLQNLYFALTGQELTFV